MDTTKYFNRDKPIQNRFNGFNNIQLTLLKRYSNENYAFVSNV